MRKAVVFYINGTKHEVGDERAGLMLADYLRYERALTGTKIVCAEGDCGACSVLRATPSSGAKSSKGANNYSSFNSCIMTVAQLDGSSLVTVDALAEAEALSPVQKSMMNCHGSQCGFCTPGFVVALTGAVEKKLAQTRSSQPGSAPTRLTEREAKNALTGNLCRCTGYQPIIDAAKDIDLGSCARLKDRFSTREQLRELVRARAEGVHLRTPDYELLAPLTLREAAKYLRANPDAKIMAAATDLGVFHNKRRARLTKVVSLHLVEGLREITALKDGRLRVGAGVTLTELREVCKKREPELAQFLDVFASPQIKNVATLAGNVANASPIADTPPFLLVASGVVHVVGARGAERAIPMDEFFLGYRKTALAPGELISAISFRPTARGELTELYKVSERKDLDISNVNAAFRVSLTRSKAGTVIGAVTIAYGGVAATTLRLRKTEALLIGRAPDEALLREAAAMLQREIAPIADVRGSGTYRRVIAENLLAKFFDRLAKGAAT